MARWLKIKLQLDVRNKLLMITVLSLMALIYQRLLVLAIILGISISLMIAFGVSLKRLLVIKKLIMIYFALIIIQSLFVKSGTPILVLGDLYLLTTDGIIYGFSVVLRLFILICLALILLNVNMGEITLALVKLKIPYEIVLMVQMGIRFIPILYAEMQNILNSIQLRGVDLRKDGKLRVIGLYVSIFSPMIYGIWDKADKLAMMLELRGFRKHPDRSYYKEISFGRIDYFVMVGVALSTVMLVWLFGLV